MTDLICIILSVVIACLVFCKGLGKSLEIHQLEMFGFITLSILIYNGILIMTNVYEETIEACGKLSPKILLKMGFDLIFGTVFIAAFLYFMDVDLSRLFYGCYLGAIVITILINRIILMETQYAHIEQDKGTKNILVVGCSEKGQKYIDEIKKHKYLNMDIVGYIHIKTPQGYEGVKHIGSLENLKNILEHYVIDEIAVARPLSYDGGLKEILNRCQDRGVTITMLLDVQNTDTAKAHVAMVGSIPVLKLHTVSLNESQLFAKRILDICGASVGMLIFGFFYIILAPFIKLETPGPVIFKQDRVGRNGRIFKVWKFRSMGVNAEKEKAALMANNEMQGHMFKMTNDPRVTKIGAFIRKTSIDELPQFYNVLKGDMSLVGTRPPTVNEVKEYETHHHKRISVTPGITGNWQVSGRSDIEDFEEVVRLDSEYIAKWSIWEDVRILLKTVVVVVKGKGSK
jgi:exopolysaccharide biosynthesis polyprenyl glycosylphosphotransferase